MYYTFLGMSNSGEYRYSVTLKFFMRCNSGRQFYNPALVSIFNSKTSVLFSTIEVVLNKQETISLTNTNPCISNPPTVCYEVGYYTFFVVLPASADGYKIASQVTYRIQGINNLIEGYAQIGATYTAEIPASNSFIDGQRNNSAVFIGSDLVIVCANNSFTYSFAALDNDGDQLRYSFCEAYTHSNGNIGTASGIPPGTPPYPSVPYGIAYNGQRPLGNGVSINPSTGLITGIAPADGAYVVTVCVEEIRNGIVIATQRKDLQINIAPCTLVGALLSPEYMVCKESKTMSISNQSMSTLVKTQNWSIFDQSGSPIATSTNPVISHTFSDTGLYKIKLVVNSGMPCSDSTTSIAKVYPGFVPNFSFNGICFNKPSQYIDQSTSNYGAVNSWIWSFGEATTFDDTSNSQNPAYTFPTMGRKYTQLVVGNTMGCKDSLLMTLDIIDKPPVQLAFKDTLICVNDMVQLNAKANGIFSWSPTADMTNANSNTPTVTPTSTTTYYVDLDDNGCLNRDSVKVRVTDHVNLQAMNDTTICEGDTIRLRVISDGFKHSWTPASQLPDPSGVTPLAITKTTTTYQVRASIGGCSASDFVVVRTVPYPYANAGADTMICDNTFAQLNASIRGSVFSWSPTATLLNPLQLNTVATPKASTTYTLIVYDSEGCPKPGIDQVTVKVLPPIKTFVSGDTAIIRGQPLQLNASGGVNYVWSPSLGLSNPNIANPIASFIHSGDSVRYKVQVFNEAGCYDSGFVLVTVYKTEPTVFVPNAFTPDNDGKNDRLKPISVGMKEIKYFQVYNRWGQLVFTTVTNKQGWDGTVKGKAQNPGIYVWSVKAIDYTGKSYIQKGTAVLIR